MQLLNRKTRGAFLSQKRNELVIHTETCNIGNVIPENTEIRPTAYAR
jgi:hypothetical protein